MLKRFDNGFRENHCAETRLRFDLLEIVPAEFRGFDKASGWAYNFGE
jgi:hypothetical protein